MSRVFNKITSTYSQLKCNSKHPEWEVHSVAQDKPFTPYSVWGGGSLKDADSSNAFHSESMKFKYHTAVHQGCSA